MNKRNERVIHIDQAARKSVPWGPPKTKSHKNNLGRVTTWRQKKGAKGMDKSSWKSDPGEALNFPSMISICMK